MKKRILSWVLGVATFQLFTWGLIYRQYGVPWCAEMALGWTIASGVELILLRGNWVSASAIARAGLFGCLVGNFTFTYLLGGVLVSCGQLFWVVIVPIGAGLFLRPRAVLIWLQVCIAVLLLALFLEPASTPGTSIPPRVQAFMLTANVAVPLAFVGVTLWYFMVHENLLLQLLARERQRSEQLLLNIFPAEIAVRLRDRQATIADFHECVSILFVDLANFTKLAAALPPIELVRILNDLFTEFDRLAEQVGVEKIKTIGDCYMVVAGLPHARSDHAQVLTEMALAIRAILEQSAVAQQYGLKARMGISSGPVVAGVIGLHKFAYDLWGDTVNIASRMESHGVIGEIQISETTYDAIRDQYDCESRGRLEVKGVGITETWLVVGRKVCEVAAPTRGGNS